MDGRRASLNLRDFRRRARFHRGALPLYSRNFSRSLLHSGVGGAVGKLRGSLLHFLFLRLSSGRVISPVYNDVEKPKKAFTRVLVVASFLPTFFPSYLHLSVTSGNVIISFLITIRRFALLTLLPLYPWDWQRFQYEKICA